MVPTIIRDVSGLTAAHPETGEAQCKQRSSTRRMNCNILLITGKRHRIQPPFHHKLVRSTEIEP